MEIEELRGKVLEEVSKLPEEQAADLKEKIESMDEKELLDFVKQSSSAECLFCQIVAGKIKTIKAYESASILAILDINPANPGHILVMPKQHYQFVTQLSQELLYELFSFVKCISPVLLDIVKAEGVDIYVAQGISQRVPHLAINIIPRFKDDKAGFAPERKKIPEGELIKTAEAIKKEVATRLKEENQKIVKKDLEKEESESAENAEKSEEEKETESMMRFYKERTP